jgi:hypothetical protein
MSRSKRKPVFKEGYGSKTKGRSKQLANRATRVTKEVANGGAFKKVFNSWDICDYIADCRFDDITGLTKREKARRVRK